MTGMFGSKKDGGKVVKVADSAKTNQPIKAVNNISAVKKKITKKKGMVQYLNRKKNIMATESELKGFK